MGLFVKKNHEKVHLCSLAGMEQFFLGRKDDLDGLKQDNLHKIISIINKNFDRQFEKYLLDLNEHISYMLKNEKKKYIKKRKIDLTIKLQMVK